MSDLEAEFAEFVVSFVLRIFILALQRAKVSNEAQMGKKENEAQVNFLVWEAAVNEGTPASPAPRMIWQRIR